jgi:hypothetical protein
MPRRRAHLTQADVARAIRAAKQAGAAAVVVLPDGSIKILFDSPPLAPEQPLDNSAAADEDWTTAV